MTSTSETPAAFVLGGNASTIAFTSDLRTESGSVTAYLVPAAVTPLGTVLGETRQRVTIASGQLVEWIDRQFPPDDERAFAASARDVELLARIGWHAPIPDRLDEHSVINADDLPEDVFDALARDAEPLVQCASCRRLCVRDAFVWRDRHLCAWDHHALVFGKRGPWRTGPYEDHHFETLPRCAYVVPQVLDELDVELVLAIDGVPEALARRIVNLIPAEDRDGSYMAVRVRSGYVLLREAQPGGTPPA